MENKEKLILKKVLIDASFDEVSDKGWYKCGSNYINIVKLLDIINRYNNFDEKRLKKEIEICKIELEISKLKDKLEVLKKSTVLNNGK